VNEQKSAVDRPWKRKFLGFSFTWGKVSPKICIHKENVKRFKQKIRELTSRKKSIDMERRIERLNRYLVGWLGYYQLAETLTGESLTALFSIEPLAINTDRAWA